MGRNGKKELHWGIKFPDQASTDHVSCTITWSCKKCLLNTCCEFRNVSCQIWHIIIYIQMICPFTHLSRCRVHFIVKNLPIFSGFPLFLSNSRSMKSLIWCFPILILFLETSHTHFSFLFRSLLFYYCYFQRLFSFGTSPLFLACQGTVARKPFNPFGEPH